MHRYKFFKKAMSAILTLSLLITGIALPQGASAAVSSVWANIASEYDTSDSFYIESSEDMDAFISSITDERGYDGKTVYLLSDVEQTANMALSECFYGRFYGLGHTVEVNNTSGLGVFTLIATGVVDGVSVTGDDLGYGIAYASFDAAISNCVVSVSAMSRCLVAFNMALGGGIVAMNLGTIDNCAVFGDITPSAPPAGTNVESTYIGGIAGYNRAEGAVSDCYFDGTVAYPTAATGLGAIVGGPEASENCYFNSDKYTASADETATGLTTLEMTAAASDTASLAYRLNGNAASGEWSVLDPLTLGCGVTERAYPIPTAICGTESEKVYFKEIDGAQREIIPIATEEEFKAWNGVGDAILLNDLEFSDSDMFENPHVIVHSLEGTLFGNGKTITVKGALSESSLFSTVRGALRDVCLISEPAEGSGDLYCTGLFSNLTGVVSSSVTINRSRGAAVHLSRQAVDLRGTMNNCAFFSGVDCEINGTANNCYVDTDGFNVEVQAPVRNLYQNVYTNQTTSGTDDELLAFRTKFLSGTDGATPYFPSEGDNAVIDSAWAYTDLTGLPEGVYRVEYPVPASVYEAARGLLPYESLYFDGTTLCVPTTRQMAALSEAASDEYIEIGNSAEFYSTISANGVDKKYRLTTDIPVTVDLSAAHPIDENFTGELDGNGHKITLQTSGSGDFLGLFSALNNAEVHNLTIDVSASSNKSTGALAGTSSGSSIKNVDVLGSLTATGGNVGGLIGNADTSEFSDCESSVALNVSGGFDCVGGIVGEANKCAFENVKNSGDVTASPADSQPFHIGGIVGYMKKSDIISEIGASLENSENSGAITVLTSKYIDKRYVGGIAGLVEETLTIGGLTNSGAINAKKTTNIGGIIGSISCLDSADSVTLSGGLTNYAPITGENLLTNEDCTVGGIFAGATAEFIGSLNAVNYGDITEPSNGAGICGGFSILGSSPMTLNGELVNYGAVTSSSVTAIGVAGFLGNVIGNGALKLINHGKVSAVSGEATGVLRINPDISANGIIAENTANVSGRTAAGIATVGENATLENIKAVNSGRVSASGNNNQFGIDKGAATYKNCTAALYGAEGNTTQNLNSGNSTLVPDSSERNKIHINGSSVVDSEKVIRAEESLPDGLICLTERISGATVYSYPVPEGCEAFVTSYIVYDSNSDTLIVPTKITRVNGDGKLADSSGTAITSSGIYVLESDIDGAVTASVADFAGVLLGDGHSVTLNMTGTNNGLFSKVSGGSVVNLITRGSVSSEEEAVGSAIGTLKGGFADKLINLASVTGTSRESENCTGGNIGKVSAALNNAALINIASVIGTYTYGYMGGNIGKSTAALSDVTLKNYGSVSSQDDNRIGGNIGTADAEITDGSLENSGDIRGGTYLGGNIGEMTANIVGTELTNSGRVYSDCVNDCPGGNIGRSGNTPGTAEIRDCELLNSGAVYSDYNSSGGNLGNADRIIGGSFENRGGVTGWCAAGNICKVQTIDGGSFSNSGEISSLAIAGGNAANVTTVDSATFINSGNVAGVNQCGGNIGVANSGAVTDSVLNNTGNVSGMRSVGGNVGAILLKAVYEWQNWYNGGNVAGRQNVGGVVGSVELADAPDTNALLTLKNCLVTGTVSGGKKAGAIVGYIGHGSTNASDASAVLSSCYFNGEKSTMGAIGFIFDKTKVTETDCGGCSEAVIKDSFFSVYLNEDSEYIWKHIDFDTLTATIPDKSKLGWIFVKDSYPLQTALMSDAELAGYTTPFAELVNEVKNETKPTSALFRARARMVFNTVDGKYYRLNQLITEAGFLMEYLSANSLSDAALVHSNSFKWVGIPGASGAVGLCRRVLPLMKKTGTSTALSLASGANAEKTYNAASPETIAVENDGEYTRVTDPTVGAISGNVITCGEAGTAALYSAKRETADTLPSSAALRFTVKKADILYTISNDSVNYDGTAKMFTLTHDTGIGAALTLGDSAGLSAGYTLTNAGSYTVQYALTPTDTRNYNTMSGSHGFTINAVRPTLTLGASGDTASGVTLTATFGSLAAAKDWSGTFGFYDGTALLASNISIDEASKTAVYSIPAKVASGTHNYRAVYYPGANDNYLTNDIACAFDPEKVNQTGFSLAAIDAVYGDTGIGAAASGGQSTGNVTYSLASGDCITVDGSGAITINGAGTATIRAVKLSDSYYNEAGATASVNVAKFTPSVSFADKTAVYNGSAVVLSDSERPTVTLTNGDSTDYNNISYSYRKAGGTASFAAGMPTDAGVYEVRAEYRETANYNAASGIMTLTVLPITAELRWSGNSFVYDGNEKSVAASVKNAVGDDSFALAYDGTVKATNAGDYNAALTSLGNNNYVLPTGGVSLDWAIAPSPTNGISLVGFDGAYDKTAHGVTVIGAEAGDKISYSTDNIAFSETAPSFTNAGSYTVYVKVDCANKVDFSGSAAVNIGKAVPNATSAVGASAILDGGILSNSTLSGEFDTAGTLSWEDDTLSVSETGSFAAVFVPTDGENYETVRLSVEVVVYSIPEVKKPEIVEETKRFETNAENAAEKINEALKGLKDGEKAYITVDMGDSESLEKDVIEAIRGTNAVIELNMTMPDGTVYSWVIDGSTIDPDAEFVTLNMGVELYGDGIPESNIEGLNEQLETLGGGAKIFPLTLNHSGEFGFTPVLKINVGKDMAGKKVQLIYYNPVSGELERAGEPIEVDENGDVLVPFRHASEYLLVVLDSNQMTEFAELLTAAEPTEEPSEEQGETDIEPIEEPTEESVEEPEASEETEKGDEPTGETGIDSDSAAEENGLPEKGEPSGEENPATGAAIAIPAAVCAAATVLFSRRRKRRGNK